MYIGLWLLSAGHVSILLHLRCTPGPSPYIYKRKVQGPRTEKGGRAGGRADEQALSLANACNPLLQAHPPWAQDNTKPRFSFPLVFRLAPTHLGWDTQRQFTRRSRDPRGRNADMSVEIFFPYRRVTEYFSRNIKMGLKITKNIFIRREALSNYSSLFQVTTFVAAGYPQPPHRAKPLYHSVYHLFYIYITVLLLTYYNQLSVNRLFEAINEFKQKSCQLKSFVTFEVLQFLF
jgi:hypothetical protein